MGQEFAMPLPLALLVPTQLAIVAALFGALAWLGMHLIPPPESQVRRVLLSLARFVAGICAAWLMLIVLQRFLVLETLGGTGFTAVLTALAVEGTIALYRFERQGLPRVVRRLVGGLRVALVLLLLLVLVKPVFSRKFSEKDERIVAVLVDESESMDQGDPQADVSEKLERAELLLTDQMPHRIRPQSVIESLREVHRLLAVEADWLRYLAGTVAAATAGEMLDERREKLIANLEECSSILETRRKELVELATSRNFAEADALQSLNANLAVQVGEVISASQKAVRRKDVERLGADSIEVSQKLSDAGVALVQIIEELTRLSPAVDTAFLSTMEDELRKQIDDAAARPRRDVVRALMTSTVSEKPGIVEALQDKYTVKLYRFAGVPVETTLQQLGKPGTSQAETAPLSETSRQVTDLAAALERTLADTPRQKLAGALILSDGRHNAKTSLETVGHALAMRNAPVCSVLVGSTVAVTDAAVSELVSPRRVQVEDQLVLSARLKINGLNGQVAEVTLSHDGETLETKTVQVTADVYRTEVELTDSPKVTGLRAYEVAIKPLNGERTEDNNVQRAFVHVTDDPTHLLVIENRPRWEFRYLRNLFADRDKSVRLQHVLMQPDWIEGQPERPKVHASVARGVGESEATHLPETEKDWLLFDAIVLGDVSPDQLAAEQAEILKKFVDERGGRLIVIAGQNYMPHAFATSPVAEMLPVTFAPSAEPLNLANNAGFFVRLTPDGRHHIVTQLDADPEANTSIWEGAPELRVRHPIEDTKPGAMVLAFAMPLDAPACFRESRDEPDEAQRLARERQQFMRQNALIAVQPYGAGRVLMLNFDGTWRLRYRKGDQHHHRFWGQVLRWATTDKLPAGNELARLGTDRIVYEPDEPIVVRARLRDENNDAVETTGASVTVTAGDEVVSQKNLEPTSGSPGMYQADLGTLPPGEQYQVVLQVKDAAQAELATAAKDVSTRFMVAPAGSLEMAELTADPSTLESLAQQTAGIVVGPRELHKVIGHLGPGTREIVREKRYPLWYSWPLFVTLTGIVTAEWIIRKKAGLV